MDTKPKNLVEWPPAFTLKKSARARHIKLKASKRYGLELVVPLRFNQKFIPDILETNKTWIEKQLAKIQLNSLAQEKQDLPDAISFPLINKVWKIHPVKSANKKLQLLVRPQQELVLLGNIDNKAIGIKLLLSWVKQQAQIELPLALQKISQEIGLSYEKVNIRNQRSRWGSCSNRKTINLNFKLMFLPEHMVKHILIHELCHTVHMNHSAKFWRLVASFDPDWKAVSRETRRADRFIPHWALEL